MKKSTLIYSALMLALAACGGEKEAEKTETTEETADTTAKTEEVKEEEMAAPPDSAAMMKAWMDYATPGDMHKMLAKYDGKWNAETKMWMDPKAEPTVSNGKSENKMIYNGLYQVSTHTGEFNGMPFMGQSTTGYDNARKKFVASWVDNMGSGILMMEGDWDEATKSITLTGKQTDPMTGKTCEIKEVMTFIDDNNQKMEMYGQMYPGAEMVKTMEIKYTRAK